MVDIYVIVDWSTGGIAHKKPYFSVGAAKLAIKCHKDRPEDFAVARISGDMRVVSTVDKDGKWTEVFE